MFRCREEKKKKIYVSFVSLSILVNHSLCFATDLHVRVLCCYAMPMLYQKKLKTITKLHQESIHNLQSVFQALTVVLLPPAASMLNRNDFFFKSKVSSFQADSPNIPFITLCYREIFSVFSFFFVCRRMASIFRTTNCLLCLHKIYVFHCIFFSFFCEQTPPSHKER